MSKNEQRYSEEDAAPLRVAVLISGSGSNLQALIHAIAAGRLDATIAVVISNRADAPGLDRARASGIETVIVSHRGFPTREDYDRALVKELQTRDIGLVCLAGFMRLVGAPLIDAFPNRILNIRHCCQHSRDSMPRSRRSIMA